MKIRIDSYFWLTLLLSLPVVGPLLLPGYFWGAHDSRHAVYFLQQFDRVFRDGVWYPRWIPDMAFGYGYPFFNVYGPLSSYIGEMFHLVGLDIVTSVKLVFGLSAALAGPMMYLFVRRLLGRPAGLIAGLVYVYIPYHLFDLYVRSDLAEATAFVFVPLVLWGFYESITRLRLSALVWTAIAYAALMLTHPLSAFIMTGIMGLYVAYMFITNLRLPSNFSLLISRFSPPRFASLRSGLSSLFSPFASLLSPLFVLLLGLGLSAIYLLPALTEARYVRTDQWFGGRFAFGDDFVDVFQLFSPQWGFGTSIPGPDDQAGFQIGLAALVLFILSFLVVPKLTKPTVRRTLYFFQTTVIITAFLTTPLSTLAWSLLPLTQLVQFPWRLLVVIAPFIAAVAGAVVSGDRGQGAEVGGRGLEVREQGIGNEGTGSSERLEDASSFTLYPSSFTLVILSCLILLSSYPYLKAQVRDPKPTEGPVSLAALFRFQQSADEMTGQTAWVQRIPNWSTLAEQVVNGGEIKTKVNYTALPADNSLGVYSMEMDSQHELLWVGSSRPGQTVTFMMPYYPGWQAYIYADLGPHDGNLDKTRGPVTRIGPLIDHPALSTTPIEGWMVVPVPVGPHFLEIRFEDTPVRVVGRWGTIVSAALAVGLLVVARRGEKRWTLQSH